MLSPMSDPLNLLSGDSVMKRFSARANWQKIIDVQEWRWEALRTSPERLSEYIWSNDMQYLLEAYLRLEKNREADELIRIWSQSPEWSQIKQSAVALAEKCGRTALAEQWRKL